MSQDRDSCRDFSDSDEDEQSETSTSSVPSSGKTEISVDNIVENVGSDVASGASRSVTDEDSSSSKSGTVEDPSINDEIKCPLKFKYGSSSVSGDSKSFTSQTSTRQSPPKQTAVPSSLLKPTKQADVHQKANIPTTPSKRRYPSSTDDSESAPDIKKHIISTEQSQKAKHSKRMTSTEPNPSLLPEAIFQEKLEKEFVRTVSEEHEESRLPAHRSEFCSQDTVLQSLSKHTEAPSLSAPTATQGAGLKDSKISGTPTKRSVRPLDEKLKSQPDTKKRIISIEANKGGQQNKDTSFEPNFSFPPNVISKEKFGKETASEEHGETSLPTHRSELYSQSSSSPSTSKQADAAGLSGEAAKQADFKESNAPSTSKGGFRSSHESREYQPGSEKRITPTKPIQKVGPYKGIPSKSNSPIPTEDINKYKFKKEFARMYEEQSKIIKERARASLKTLRDEAAAVKSAPGQDRVRDTAGPPEPFPRSQIQSRKSRDNPFLDSMLSTPKSDSDKFPLNISGDESRKSKKNSFLNAMLDKPKSESDKFSLDIFKTFKSKPPASRHEIESRINQQDVQNFNRRSRSIGIGLSELFRLLPEFQNALQGVLSGMESIVAAIPDPPKSERPLEPIEIRRNRARIYNSTRVPPSVPNDFINIIQSLGAAVRGIVDDLEHYISIGNVSPSMSDNIADFLREIGQRYEGMREDYMDMCAGNANYGQTCRDMEEKYSQLMALFMKFVKKVISIIEDL